MTRPSALLLFFTVFVSCCVQAQEKGYDDYRSILDKGMFPAAPEVKLPTPIPHPPYVAPVDNWTINYRVNMVYRHYSSGVFRIGVQNIKGETGHAVNMVLEKGETHAGEGITIEDVVEDAESGMTVVKISKNGQTQAYQLSRTLVAAAGMPARRSTRSANIR